MLDERLPPARPRRSASALLTALASLGAVIAVGLSLGGEPAQFAWHGLTVAPFCLLAALLQVGRTGPWRVLAWATFWLTILGFALLSFIFVVMAVTPAGAEWTDTQPAAVGTVSLLLVLSLLIAALLSLVGWRRVGRWLGARLDRDDPAHAIGLVGCLAMTAISLAPLVALSGQPPILLALARDPALLGAERPPEAEVLDLYYGLIWLAPLALLGAGLPARRDLRASLARLGFGPLNRRQVALLSGLALGLVGLSFGLDAAINGLWERLDWPRTDTAGLERLFAPYISPFGAVSVALSAGIGEELLTRGLLQPRLGWFLPNLTFAAGHGFQYGADGLLSVFLTGAALAAVRARWNTTAAALVHAVYDFVLILGASLQLPGF